jgi:hypothetical protein
MPTEEVIRHLGEKLRELIPVEVEATTEMQAPWCFVLHSWTPHVDLILGRRSQMPIPNCAWLSK